MMFYIRPVLRRLWIVSYSRLIVWKSCNLQISARALNDAIETATDTFSERFTTLLAPNVPFDKPKYQKFAKSMFSNLLGGIGYFYGDTVVDRSYAPEYEEENEGFWEETAEARSRVGSVKLEGPSELFTSIPSRPFFPRGFLWDEGFHLIPIADWDMDLTWVYSSIVLSALTKFQA